MKQRDELSTMTDKRQKEEEKNELEK